MGEWWFASRERKECASCLRPRLDNICSMKCSREMNSSDSDGSETRTRLRWNSEPPCHQKQAWACYGSEFAALTRVRRVHGYICHSSTSKGCITYRAARLLKLRIESHPIRHGIRIAMCGPTTTLLFPFAMFYF